jgi:hypothetical protein
MQGEYKLIQVLSSCICASLNLLQARIAFLSEKASEGVAEVVTPLQVGRNSACPSGFAYDHQPVRLLALGAGHFLPPRKIPGTHFC